MQNHTDHLPAMSDQGGLQFSISESYLYFGSVRLALIFQFQIFSFA